MGMFDFYEPSEVLHCNCARPLTDWQGKDGPCGLMLWRQGSAAPVAQRAGEVNLDRNGLEEFRLPASFEIYSYSCETCGRMEAVCRTENGVWRNTELVTAENAMQKKEETRAQFAARKMRIGGNAT